MKPVLIFNQVWRGDPVGDAVSQSKFTARMLALQCAVERHGGAILEVQDQRWHRSKWARLVRPVTIVGEIARLRPDVVFLQYPNYPFFWSLRNATTIRRSLLFLRLLRRFCRKEDVTIALDYRDVQTNATEDGSASGVSDGMFAAFEQMVFRSSDAIWCSSSGLMRDLQERYALRGTGLQLVPNGGFAVCTPRAESGISSAQPVRFVYAGDLRQSGHAGHLLLQAIQRSTRADCKFVICGPGGDWMVPLVEGDGRVEMLGEMPRSEVMRTLARCDVGLVPLPKTGAWANNFPTKLGEYVVSGLAVLTTPSREAAEFVTQNEIGLVAEAGEWPQAIGRLASNGGILQRLRSKSRLLSLDMCWDRIFERAFTELETHVFEEGIRACARSRT